MTPSECIICSAPLGQESKDLGWIVCKKHRSCEVCTGELKPQEAQNAFDTVQDLLKLEHNQGETLQTLLPKFFSHSRCQLATPIRKDANQDPSVSIQQSHLDWLNNFRLLCEPNMELSPESNERESGGICERIVVKMSLEQKFIFMARLESAVAHVSVLISKDRKVIKEQLDKREAKKFKEATEQALVSGRPSTKKVDDVEEIKIGEFLKINGFETTAGRKLWKERQKSIQGLMKNGMNEAAATMMVDTMLRSNGRIK